MLKLIVGLANPGEQYQKTRHNAGAWWIEALKEQFPCELKLESKYKALFGQAVINHRKYALMIPQTFMNLSGQSVAAYANFYKLEPEQILVVHDELDIPPGEIRFKHSGGFGGHNGLKDIGSKLGSKDFYRLRIGIGHPGNPKQVSGYVLKKPKPEDKNQIDDAIQYSLKHLDDLLSLKMTELQNNLHAYKP